VLSFSETVRIVCTVPRFQEGVDCVNNDQGG